MPLLVLYLLTCVLGGGIFYLGSKAKNAPKKNLTNKCVKAGDLPEKKSATQKGGSFSRPQKTSTENSKSKLVLNCLYWIFVVLIGFELNFVFDLSLTDVYDLPNRPAGRQANRLVPCIYCEHTY